MMIYLGHDQVHFDHNVISYGPVVVNQLKLTRVSAKANQSKSSILELTILFNYKIVVKK